MTAPLRQETIAHLIAGCLCMCMRHRVFFLSRFAVSRTQHIEHVSTNHSYRIARPCVCALTASAKSWLIRCCCPTDTCLYLSTPLNLYITLYKTTPMVSNKPQYLPVSQFQQFLYTNSSTYYRQHVQCQFVSLGQLLLGLVREFISAF